MSLPEDVKTQLERFEAAVASVETGLAPILALDRRELESALTPVERAKVHVSMANAISTMFSSASTLAISSVAWKHLSRHPTSVPSHLLFRRSVRKVVSNKKAKNTSKNFLQHPHLTTPSSRPHRPVYLRAVGLDPADHAVKRELERVELYRAKLDKAAAAERRAAAKTARSKVDVAAADRMVKHAMGSSKARADAEDDECDSDGEKESAEEPKSKKKRKGGDGNGGSREGKKKKR